MSKNDGRKHLEEAMKRKEDIRRKIKEEKKRQREMKAQADLRWQIPIDHFSSLCDFDEAGRQ